MDSPMNVQMYEVVFKSVLIIMRKI